VSQNSVTLGLLFRHQNQKQKEEEKNAEDGDRCHLKEGEEVFSAGNAGGFGGQVK